MRKLTYFLTNVRTSAAVCKLILTNVQKLVRMLTYFLTNFRTAAAVCELMIASAQKLVRKITYVVRHLVAPLQPFGFFANIDLEICLRLNADNKTLKYA